MRMNQLPLRFDRSTGVGDALVTKFPVRLSWLKARRAARRELSEFISAGASRNMSLIWRLLLDQALLDQMQAAVRRQSRGAGRKSRRRTIAYVCTREGSRAQRLINRLQLRIAAQEALLCG